MLHRKFARIAALLCLAMPVLGNGLYAQELVFLDPAQVQLITQEISGDAAYEHIRFMSQFHRPRAGSDGLWRVAEYYAERAREFGLSDARVIRQASGTTPWNASFADLWIVGETPERIASTLQTPLHLADYSRATDVTGELVDVGAGRESDYAGLDVSGKIVLTYGSAFSAMERAVFDRGALGVVWYPDPFSAPNGINGAGISHPDQIRWLSLPSGGTGERRPTFAFSLSVKQGVALRNRLASSDDPVMVHAVVESEFSSEQGEEPWQVMVEAFIRGSDPSLNQDIVLTGHLQEEGTSANDDASGTASVLEIARALNSLIESGRIERPRRNLRFWWVTEISSQRQFFADNPDQIGNLWVNVNQDMVGANQAQDVMRKQAITRLPATRFHFFNDVVESVVEYMVAGNTYELAQAQNGFGLYPKPHLSHLGTEHRYNAGMIFFHNNTDHMPFNEAPIGIPAVTFTNMPDRFIHSSDDDLWNVDRTQLGRNAAAVALIAYTMASSDREMAPILTAETVGRGLERLARNFRLGASWLAARTDKEQAFHDAVNQIEYAVARERMALESLLEIGMNGQGVNDLIEGLDMTRRDKMRELEMLYRRQMNSSPPIYRNTETERTLATIRPVLTAGPEEFLTLRYRIGNVQGLHGLMSFEILNAVNGERTGLDIYRFVSAEALEGGEHYYGVVTAEAVLEYLRNAEAAGVIETGG